MQTISVSNSKPFPLHSKSKQSFTPRASWHVGTFTVTLTFLFGCVGFQASFNGSQPSMKFVMDTSKYWFRPHVSRAEGENFSYDPTVMTAKNSISWSLNVPQLLSLTVAFCHFSLTLAEAMVKDKEAGTFVVRDSTSYRGSFGLAMKVDQTSVNHIATATHPGKLLLGTGDRHNNCLWIKRAVQCWEKEEGKKPQKHKYRQWECTAVVAMMSPCVWENAENHLLNPADVKGHVQLFVESAVIFSTHSKHCVNTKKQLFMTL